MIHLKFAVKFVLIALVIVLLAGCGPSRIMSKLVPTETMTGNQQSVKIMQPAHTGNRDDVPTGWKPKDTTTIKLKDGGEIYFNKATGAVGENESAEKITQAIEVPKWSWAWLYWLIGIMGLLAAGDWLLKAYFGVNPFGWIMKKILKK